MRNLVFILLLLSTLPAFPASHITVQQLEQLLATGKNKPDADVAKELDGLELTERLNLDRFEQLIVGLKGDKSKQALITLADTSAFLPPSPIDIPATATP